MIHDALVILAAWFLGSIPLGLLAGRLLAARSRAEQAYWDAVTRSREGGVAHPAPLAPREALSSSTSYSLAHPAQRSRPDSPAHHL